MFGTNAIRDFLDGFADNLQIADDGVERLCIHVKLFFGEAFCVTLNLVDGIQNVVQINPIIPPHVPLLSLSSVATSA